MATPTNSAEVNGVSGGDRSSFSSKFWPVQLRRKYFQHLPLPSANMVFQLMKVANVESKVERKMCFKAKLSYRSDCLYEKQGR